MIKKQIAFHSTEIEEVYILYQQAFPKNEQMDLTQLFDELHLGAIYGYYQENQLVGFAILCIQSQIAHILYLAVKKEYRDQGIGSYILNDLAKQYDSKKIIVDIEKIKDTSNKEQRIKRKQFYLKNDFKENLLNAIARMSPKKFEAFSRSLLTKMSVEFTNQGVQISNDGGIDGYGYHKDLDDFRTTRVVNQCKRYNVGPVTEPDINQFLGAMNKFQADYGVFITNSRFTNSARVASREGSPITLIDGNDLVDLVIRYQLYITPVTTYILDDFYSE